MIQKHINYISIQSVIDDVQSIIPESEWNEDNILEWIAKAYKSINLEARYETAIALLEVQEHRATLPCDIQVINQIFYKADYEATVEDLESVKCALGLTDNKPWVKHMAHSDEFIQSVLNTNDFGRFFKPLRRNASNFGVTPCVSNKVPNSACRETYSLGIDYITTSFKEGCIVLSFKKFITDDDGLFMIPDNEELKMALFHFCLYRWWMARSIFKEQATFRERQIHYREWARLKRSAVAKLNRPDTDIMERIKSTRNRLVPRENFYDRGFSNLTNREDISF